MPLDPEFLADCPYRPEGLLIDELVLCDRETSRVVCRMPTHAELPFTRDQRVHPVKHPRHVNGGVLLHASGMAGMVHGYYLLGLRHAEGWIGYGARAKDVRFKNLAHVGEPIDIDCQALQVRRGAKNVIARYRYVMTQGDQVVYESEQTAMFVKVES
jgi:3-hydroxymyristoyl/3-hydroxydecanoyl-(acyl carrier protein) dehydratase